MRVDFEIAEDATDILDQARGLPHPGHTHQESGRRVVAAPADEIFPGRRPLNNAVMESQYGVISLFSQNRALGRCWVNSQH